MALESKILSKRDMANILDFITTCASYDSDTSSTTPFENINQLVPVDGVAAVIAQMDTKGRIEKNRVVNISYPAKWIDIYERRNYAAIDPVVRRHFATFTIQKWSDTRVMAACPTECGFWEEATSFGLTSGLTLGVSDRRMMRASLFSFYGAGLEENSRHAVVLSYVIPHIHEAFFRSKLSRASGSIEISNREKEVLTWVKCGKTNWEISQILAISERTVKFHLARLAEKFGARGRSHIVAIALARGLVDFF